MCIRDSVCADPVSLSDRTKERWVMIDVVFERYQYLQNCDLLNEGGLGDIRSLKYTAETVGATVNVIQPPITHCNNTEKEQSYIELNRKWLRQKEDRLGYLKIYINGYLFMIIEDFEEIKASLNDISTVNDTQTLHYRKGQLDILELVLGRKAVCEKVYEDLQG